MTVTLEPKPEDLKHPCPKCQHPTVRYEDRRKCLNCGTVCESQEPREERR